MGSDGSHGPKPWTKHRLSTLFLRVPGTDWPAVKRGLKREFRAGSGKVSQFHGVQTPTPVVGYTVNRRGAYDRQLMVLEKVWQEPLGAISPESLTNEGFASIREFRRYWMAREKKRFRPLNNVFVYRVRPWEPNDKMVLGAALLERLYREHLEGGDEAN